ncbi:OsmC family protein [uncultured Paludibacter sp.]|nr:OsmC family protein [uncultured Paludibacter sp.]
MKQTIKTEWKGDMAFETDLNGHKLVVDAADEVGGHNLGPRPKILMLAALSGCTGMDVVSILKKMRVEVKACNIYVEADVTEEHPKHYEKMHIIYEFIGKDLPMAKLEKAVNMSQETYCGVSAVYKKAMEVTSEIRVVEA